MVVGEMSKLIKNITIFRAIAAGVIYLVSTLAPIQAALAGTDSGTLNVNANVQALARITSVSNINFGDYDPTSSTHLDTTGSVSVRATKGLVYNIYFGNDRSMTDGTDTLSYEFFVNAARTVVWGDSLATSETYTSSSNAVSSKQIYARVPALQDVQAGAYADTVIVTLEF